MTEQSTTVPPLVRTFDNAFWFEAAAAGRLLIQRCAACGELRHPPGPACPACRSFEWDTVEASRRGVLHSWTVVHYPQDPAFSYPLAVGLVDLDVGARIVADFEPVDQAELAIGREVEIFFAEHAHGEILPRLRLVAPAAPGQAS